MYIIYIYIYRFNPVESNYRDDPIIDTKTSNTNFQIYLKIITHLKIHVNVIIS